MIPKIIHQIWIGKRSMSESNLLFVQKWKEMYPEYDHILWNNDSIKDSGIVPEDKKKYLFSDKYPVALRADILRYEILRKFGGIYVDVDVEPLKRFRKTILNYKFFTGEEQQNIFCNAVIGAQPMCPLIGDLCDDVIWNITSSNYSIDSVNVLTGPIFFSRICHQYKHDIKYKFYKQHVFYPYLWTEKHRRNENFRITSPASVMVHHWNGEWK